MTRLEQLQGKLPVHAGIHTQGEYIATAVLALLLFMGGEYHFVFQKRSPHIRQNGEICFPGGVCHPGDSTPERTAIRETSEEMGIPAEKIKVIGALDAQIASVGAIVHAFVGVADISSLDEIAANKDEVEFVFTVPVAHFEKNEPEKYQTLLKVHPAVTDEKTGQEIVLFPARDLGLPDKYTKPWGSLKHDIYVYKVDQRVIWGITARFIVDIVNKLKS
jgi:8-oxo-dGTP pyrophosphatase MutT (NUDIX family)